MNLIIHEKLLKNLKILRVLPDYRKILESLGSIVWFKIAQLEIFYPEEKKKNHWILLFFFYTLLFHYFSSH